MTAELCAKEGTAYVTNRTHAGQSTPNLHVPGIPIMDPVLSFSFVIPKSVNHRSKLHTGPHVSRPEENLLHHVHTRFDH